MLDECLEGSRFGAWTSQPCDIPPTACAAGKDGNGRLPRTFLRAKLPEQVFDRLYQTGDAEGNYNIRRG
jgi:hypothetical protein